MRSFGTGWAKFAYFVPGIGRTSGRLEGYLPPPLGTGGALW
jgi:hypothetical protein